MIAYVDASALLRVVLAQADALSEWPRIRRGISSRLIAIECLRTLDRLRLRARIPDEEVALRRRAVLAYVASLELIEIDDAILSSAAQPLPTVLGTLDAIHLVSALAWREANREEIAMATHDRELAIAAQAHGIQVIGTAL